MRDYLVFCSTRHGQCNAELGLYGENRNFDLCIHDYSDWGGEPEGVFKRSEYWFPRPRAEKFETAAEVIPTLPSYKYYAFLDDDLTATTDQLNRLFVVGEGLGLSLYQPTLTRNSYSSWAHLLTQAIVKNYNPVRSVEMVEIMCPFFSQEALGQCLPTFDNNQSGWGLDCYVWPKLVTCHAVDSIVIGHYRKPGRRDRKLRNGLTPMQELWIQKKIYDPDDCSLPPT